MKKAKVKVRIYIFIVIIDSGRYKYKEICNVCTEDKYQKEFYELPKCSHKFCKECIIGFLSVSVPEGKVTNLKCWQSGCEELFTDKDIENVLSASDNKKLYVKYLKFKRIKLLNSNPNVRWCPR
jgi:E3 ubiquitin-protein ligase RNF14